MMIRTTGRPAHSPAIIGLSTTPVARRVVVASLVVLLVCALHGMLEAMFDSSAEWAPPESTTSVKEEELVQEFPFKGHPDLAFDGDSDHLGDNNGGAGPASGLQGVTNADPAFQEILHKSQEIMQVQLGSEPSKQQQQQQQQQPSLGPGAVAEIDELDQIGTKGPGLSGEKYLDDFDFDDRKGHHHKDPDFGKLADPAFRTFTTAGNAGESVAEYSEVMDIANQAVAKRHRPNKYITSGKAATPKPTDDYEGEEAASEARHDGSDGIYTKAIEEQEHHDDVEAKESDARDDGFFRATGMSKSQVRQDVYTHLGAHDVVMTSSATHLHNSPVIVKGSGTNLVLNKVVDEISHPEQYIVTPGLKLPITKQQGAAKVMKVDASKPLMMQDLNAKPFQAIKEDHHHHDEHKEPMWDAPNGPDPAAPPRKMKPRKTTVVKRMIHHMEAPRASKKATSVKSAVHQLEKPKKKTKTRIKTRIKKKAIKTSKKAIALKVKKSLHHHGGMQGLLGTILPGNGHRQHKESAEELIKKYAKPPSKKPNGNGAKATAARIAAAARAARKSRPDKANLVEWLASKSASLMLQQQEAQAASMSLMEQQEWDAMEQDETTNHGDEEEELVQAGFFRGLFRGARAHLSNYDVKRHHHKAARMVHDFVDSANSMSSAATLASYSNAKRLARGKSQSRRLNGGFGRRSRYAAEYSRSNNHPNGVLNPGFRHGPRNNEMRAAIKENDSDEGEAELKKRTAKILGNYKEDVGQDGWGQ